ncbi:unnamed protein product [Sphenostylis stenocarpa]|uniref:Uncharacterized protein n=1 Tax=Sphenostylis stenocarpa TaxID=92480 RepID=A0AA86RPM6_9FABA|nr:unnamed protein product [Sphenostylis stenocarpa]
MQYGVSVSDVYVNTQLGLIFLPDGVMAKKKLCKCLQQEQSHDVMDIALLLVLDSLLSRISHELDCRKDEEINIIAEEK